MANDKKFIVKNGLQSENNVLIGTTTDDGVNKLQVSGTAKLTSSGTSVPITIENTGGINTPLMNFSGGVGYLQVKNSGSGDYSILNTSGANEIKFNDNTANGLVFIAGNNNQLKINTTIADFTNVPSIGGVPVWYAGNDGAGSGLDADLLDGVDSTSFVRSDQNDTMDGDYIITGNLTVQGTRTEIVSETVLIADNLITLNSNFTTGTPTENAGWEVLRGDLANSSIQWDETNDWFKLISAGTDLGRIITTADEGAGNNFDADTVDGLQAAQFIRSDVNDTATGNLEFEGTVAIGNEAGSALLTMRGAGQNRVLSSDNGKIGFLDGAFAYQTYSDLNGDWTVGQNLIADKFLDSDDNTYLSWPSDTSRLNNIELVGTISHDGDADTYINFPAANQFEVYTGAGQRLLINNTAVEALVDVIAPRYLDSGNNAYLGDFAGTSVMNTIGIDSDLFHNGDTDTKLAFATDTISLETGAAARLTITDTAVTASVDVVGPKFADSADTSYFALPSGTSVFNNLGIDEDLFHNGDTNNKISFGTDTQTFTTGGTARLTINNTSATFVNDVIAPRYLDADNNAYYGDFANTSVVNSISLQGDIIHQGDPDTLITFSASNEFKVRTGASDRLFVRDTGVTAVDNMKAPVYYDTLGTTNFLDLGQTGAADSLRVGGRINVGAVTDFNLVDNNSGTGGIMIAPYAGLGATTNPTISIAGNTGGLSLLSLNRIDMGGNPFQAKNGYWAEMLADGAAAFSIRGDSSKNTYFISDADQGVFFYDSGASTRLAMLDTGDITIGSDTVAYSSHDNTPVLAAGVKTDNKLHVDGSVQLNGANDAYVVGNGTATFLRMDELGFGSGGGFYMSNTATVRMRGNKNLLTSGTMFASRYYDNDDTTYYGDFSSSSRMNNIALVGNLAGDGDSDTYLNFNAANSIQLVAGNAQQMEVTSIGVTAPTAFLSGLFTDSTDTDFKWEPNTTSAHRFTTPTGWLEIGSKVVGSSQFDTDRALFQFNKRVNFNGGISAADGNDMAYFPTYYDYNDNAYYGDFAGTSVMNRIEIDDFIRHNGDLSTYIGFSADGVYKTVISGTERLNIDADSADFNVNVYAPRYYDSQNPAYYLDAASTSILNVARAQEIQVGTSNEQILPPSGPKGTIMVEGERDSYAGYMISNDWGFISSGATEMGLYNETDNEWSLVANRNNFTRLYSNNIHQIGAENGYGSAPNSMRSPAFYDLDDSAFYADLAGQSRLKSVKAGDSAIFNSTTYPLEVKSAQQRLIVLQNTTADANFPSIFHQTRNSRSAMGISFNNIGERFWFSENGDIQAYGAGIFGSLALNGGNEDLGLLKTYGSGLGDLKMFDASEYWEKRAIQPMQGVENNATSVTADYVKNGDGPFASSYALRTNGYRSFDSDFIAVEPGETIYAEQAVRRISGTGGLFYLGVRQYDKDKNPIDANDGIIYFAASAVNVTDTAWTELKGEHVIPTTHSVFNGSDGLGVRYVRLISIMNLAPNGATREFGPPILKRADAQGSLKAEALTIVTDASIGGDLTVTGDVSADNISANIIDAGRFRDLNDTNYYIEPKGPSKVAGQWDWTNGAINNLNSLSFNDPGPSEGIIWNGGNNWRIYESPDDLVTDSGGNLQFTSGVLNGTRRLTLTTNGDVVAGRYMDATRFRDKDNTAYYADPAGTSVLSQIYVDEYIRHSGDTNTYIRFQAADDMQLVAGGTQMLRMAEGTNPDRLRFVTDDNWTDANGDWAMSRNVVVTGTHTALNGSYASRFYDSDDNAYYLDPAAISITNTVRANAVQFGGATYQLDATTGTYGSISVTGNKGGYAGYAINDDWVFMSSGAGVAGIFNDTNDEWAQIFRQNGDVELYWDGVEQASTKDGFFLGTNQLRSPVWYDSDNTAYKIDGNGTSRLLTLQVDNEIQGSVDGYAYNLKAKDNLIIEPNEDPAGQMTFGYTTWDNSGSGTYADYLHLRSYTNSAGGSDNLLMFKKNGRGMRLWQQTWNSGTAYSAYSDIAIYNANPGGGASSYFYASRLVDSDDTSFYVDPSSTSKVDVIQFADGGEAQFITSGGNVRGYIQATDTNDEHLIIATSGGEDIAFKDGGLAGDVNLIVRGNGDLIVTAGAYASTYYDKDNGAYYGNFAATSIMNTLDIRGEIYNDGWFRNDVSGKGLYNTATTQHFYSDSDDYWNIAGGSAANGLRFRDENGGTIRGYVYADNGNNIGFTNQSNNWALRTNGGNTEIYGNVYANVYYDRNDSAFFMNPAGDNVFGGDIRANRFVHKDAVSQDDQFGLYFATGESTAYAIYREGGGWSGTYPDLRIAFHTGIKMGANASYNGMRFYDDYTMNTQVMSINNGADPLGANDVYVNNSLQAGSSLRAPIFYDSNDTNRYTNPASTSQMSTIEWDQLNARDMGDYITLYGNNNADHSISSRNASGNAADDIRINSYGSIFFNLDSNNNNTSGADFRVGRHGGTGTINNTDLFRVYGDANYAYSAFSFRAPIFYDSNDTGYYCDPSSSSNFNSYVRANEFYARNWFRNDGSGEGMYNQNTGAHSYSYQGQYWAITGNNNSSSMSLQLRATYNGTMCRWMYGDRTWAGDLNAAGQWQLQTRHQDGYSPSIRFKEEGNESWTGNIGNDGGKIEYHSNRFYIEAGGNSTLICQFRRNGTNRSYVDNNGLYVGTATSARWADLAERYKADAIYPAGTVLAISLDEGDAEVTLYEPGMPLAGAVSTDPAVMMNDMGIAPSDKGTAHQMNPYVALKGRIPVLINGTAKKGQWVIADRDGRGRAVDYGTAGINTLEVIGIAIANCDGNGEVEVKV